MLRVLVIGAQGRMGRASVAAVREAGDLVLAGTLVRGQDLGTVVRDLCPDVAIDFTEPGSVARHLACLIEARVHPVIGTTGLGAAERQAAVARSRELRLGGLVAANFSIGAVLCMQLARLAARHLGPVEIVETHHPAKKDAPSGTALATRELLSGGAHRGDIPIHSLRLPGFLARQEVILGGHGERVALTHEAIDRSCYLPGVILACRKVRDLPEVMIGLESLLDLREPGG